MTKNLSSETQLPEKWVTTSMGAVAQVVPGYGFPEKYQGKVDGEIPFFKVRDISEAFLKGSIYLKKANNYVTLSECKELRAKPLKEGSIVFAKIGEALKLNRRAILTQPSLVDNNVVGISPIPEVFYSLYAYYYLLTVRLESLSRATTVPSVRKSDIEGIKISLAPFNEQRRIVVKVEELFSFLDAGVESLRKVQAQLKRYRQAVLKYAFEGKLTEEWRRTHKDQIEPATKILEHISQENAVESNLPELPEGWIWTRLELITTNHDGKRVPVSRKKRESMKGVYPYYGASGIIDSVDKYLFDGTFLLIGEDGANLLARTTPIAFQASGKFWVNNHAHVLTSLGRVPISYLEHYINRISLAEYVTGTAQPKLTQRAMNKIPVPLAPLKEQYKIAEEISRRFSVIDEISKEMELMIKYSDRLRQSILKTAFEGKLTPQDPNDESAEELLKHIKAERFNRESGIDNQVELSRCVK